MTRTLVPADVFRVTSVSSPLIAPDGSSIAVILTRA